MVRVGGGSNGSSAKCDASAAGETEGREKTEKSIPYATLRPAIGRPRSFVDKTQSPIGAALRLLCPPKGTN